MKTLTNWGLAALFVGGLALTLASCSDDDEDGADTTEQVGGETTMGSGLTDDEALLSALLTQWCEFSSADAVSGITTQTFEPTVGEVVDNSTPYVRTLVMRTQAEADAYAVSCLSMLGINPQQPQGFQWSGALGQISYQRGSGNELGVIQVSIRQLPHLQKLRLVEKDETNAPKPTTPYYYKGDIVKYTKSGKLNGYYFLCLNDHAVDQPGNWIAFDPETRLNDVSTNNCSWAFTGDDYYYDLDQASMPLMQMWLENFLLSDEGYDDVIAKLNAAGVGVNEKNYIVPINDEVRAKVIRSIIRRADQVVLDPWKPYSDTDATPQCVKAGWEKTNEKSTSKYDVDTYTPYGLLLTNVARWSMGTTFNYWVPTLSLLKYNATGNSESDKLSARLTQAPSQYVSGYSNAIGLLGINVNSRVLTPEECGQYSLYLTAIHWTHEGFKKPNDNKTYYGLIDFTEKKDVRNVRNDWTLRNISSHELKINDDGKPYKYFEDVYSKARSNPIVKDEEGYFVPGSVIEDEQGTRWFCYAGWATNALYSTADHKARFVAFDRYTTIQENVGGKTHAFVDGDLVPESEVALIGNVLNTLFDIASKDKKPEPIEQQFLDAYNMAGGSSAKRLFVDRDTTYVYPDDQTASVSHIQATNFAYMPEGGRPAGKQPYMRFIVDLTRTGSGRNSHMHEAYPYWQMMSRYTGRQDQLDVLHVLKLSDYIPQTGAIKWDKWSHCARRGTTQRDGDFTADDRFTGTQNGYNFNDFKITDNQAVVYTSAYHEPIIYARYLELDDPGKAFMTNYNGKNYRELTTFDDNYRLWSRSGGPMNSAIWMYVGGTRVYKDGLPYVVPYLSNVGQ